MLISMLRGCGCVLVLFAAVACGGGGGNGGGGTSSTPSLPAPTGLVAKAGADFNSLVLEWNPGTGVTTYTVEYSESGAAYRPFPSSVPGGQSTVTITFDPEYPEAVIFNFRVLAQANGATSAPSNIASYTRGLKPAYFVSASADYEAGGIKVRVGQATRVDSKLTLERRRSSASTWEIVTTQDAKGGTPDTLTILDTSVVENQAYFYRASFAIGIYASAPTVSTSEALIDLLPPTDFVAIPEPGQIHLKWTNRSTSATQLFLDGWLVAPIPITPLTATEWIVPRPVHGPTKLQLRAVKGSIETRSIELISYPLPPSGPFPLQTGQVLQPDWSRLASRSGAIYLQGARPGVSSWPLIFANQALEPLIYKISVDYVTDLEIDGNGRPAFFGGHLTTTTPEGLTIHSLRYGIIDGQFEQVEEMSSEGYDGGGNLDPEHLAIDVGGSPHLIWKGAPSSRSLRYATKRGGAWEVSTLAPDIFGPGSICTTPDGGIWVGYKRNDTAQIGRRVSGSPWSWQTVTFHPSTTSLDLSLHLVPVGSNVAFVLDGYWKDRYDNLPPDLYRAKFYMGDVFSTAPEEVPGTEGYRLFQVKSSGGRTAMLAGPITYAETIPLVLVVRNVDGQYLTFPLGTFKNGSAQAMALVFDGTGKAQVMWNTRFAMTTSPLRYLTLVFSEK